jgi:hypothetical protein
MLELGSTLNVKQNNSFIAAFFNSNLLKIRTDYEQNSIIKGI